MTPEERRRILQERRAAKMKGGNASERLNNILNQGSSVNTSVTSVLDKSSPQETTSKQTTPIDGSLPTPIVPIRGHENDDPDTSDLEQLISHRASPQPFSQLSNLGMEGEPQPDLDSFFSTMFGNGADGQSGDQDPISAMMMNMMKQQQQAEGENPENLKDMEYEAKLLKYNSYKQKQLKFKFLVMRYLSIIINFVYHFVTFDQFRSSSHAYIRQEISTNTRGFIVIFLSIEAMILSSYYMITTKRKVTENVGGDNLILRLLSMASLVVPRVAQYHSVLAGILSYWEIFNIFIGDLALVLVLFGVTSYVK